MCTLYIFIRHCNCQSNNQIMFCCIVYTCANKVSQSDTWAIWYRSSARHGAYLNYARHMTNEVGQHIYGCQPLSHTITDKRLRLFGRISPAVHQMKIISPLSRISNPKARLETTQRKTQPCNWGGFEAIEYRVEACRLRGKRQLVGIDLVISGGHGNAQEEKSTPWEEEDCHALPSSKLIVSYTLYTVHFVYVLGQSCFRAILTFYIKT